MTSRTDDAEYSLRVASRILESARASMEAALRRAGCSRDEEERLYRAVRRAEAMVCSDATKLARMRLTEDF